MMNLSRFRRSFIYAYEGLQYALSTQQNMQFHFLAALLVFIIALVCGVSKLELLFLLLAIALVIVAELINTAIELAVDLAMPSPHPLAKAAKDTAAAAVLVASVFAAAIGMIVFYERLGLIWTILFIAGLIGLSIHTRLRRKQLHAGSTARTEEESS
jgi:diacylglycerol kinase